MVTELSTDLYVVEDYKIDKFDGNWEDYCELFNEY